MPGFACWVISPIGTIDGHRFQSSLRDLMRSAGLPGVETPAYFQGVPPGRFRLPTKNWDAPPFFHVEILSLAKEKLGVERGRSLKGRTQVRSYRSQMSGNPVKFRDGCATVTATNPNATALAGGKAGGGLKPKSGYRFDCTRPLRTFSEHFSAKRRMGPVRRCVVGGTRRMPSFSVLWNGGFLLF
jgi:hypothetical protein